MTQTIGTVTTSSRSAITYVPGQVEYSATMSVMTRVLTAGQPLTQWNGILFMAHAGVIHISEFFEAAR